MGGTQKPDLARRLGTRPATLRRSTGNWQLYAAVTGSAMAMATGANAAVIGGGADDSVLQTNASPAGSQNLAILRAAGLATARTRPNSTQTEQASGVPSISPNGIVPLYGTINTIQPGEWITIYGANLASDAEIWNGDFPQTLAGTSVTINNKPAYLMYASPTQINLQAPDDTATGSVSVVVTTSTGSVTSGVTLNRYSPSFSVVESPGGQQFVSGIILRSNGSGAYGGGTYDILGPTGKLFGYPTVAAKAGDIVELFAVGFGPTIPAVLAGQTFSGAAAIDSALSPLTLYIDNVLVKPSFVGISSAGLYQINLTVPPGLGEGEVPIRAMIGGMETQAQVWFSLELDLSGSGGGYGGTVIPIVSGGPIFGFSSGIPGFGGSMGGGTDGGGGSMGGGGSNGGGGSGGGGGSDARRHHKKQWHPKLNFPPKPR